MSPARIPRGKIQLRDRLHRKTQTWLSPRVGRHTSSRTAFMAALSSSGRTPTLRRSACTLRGRILTAASWVVWWGELRTAHEATSPYGTPSTQVFEQNLWSGELFRRVKATLGSVVGIVVLQAVRDGAVAIVVAHPQSDIHVLDRRARFEDVGGRMGCVTTALRVLVEIRKSPKVALRPDRGLAEDRGCDAPGVAFGVGQIHVVQLELVPAQKLQFRVERRDAVVREAERADARGGGGYRPYGEGRGGRGERNRLWAPHLGTMHRRGRCRHGVNRVAATRGGERGARGGHHDGCRGHQHQHPHWHESS